VTENFLCLTGIVTEKPIFKVSPSGVEHCLFTIEHRSVQKEVELPRNAYCYMPIVISGELAVQLKNKLSKGMQLRISGFITFQKSANNVGKIVLHAQYIEQI
tara:strand:+ start:4298 stop:4603 length:306 start_codon:yes stop_codon:yes gene_type:complete